MEVLAELLRYGPLSPVVEGDQIVVFHGAGGEGGEPVAIKLIQLAEGEAQRRSRPESFRNHAAALRAVSHPALPGFVRSGIGDDDVAFLVTRWVDGAPLGLPPRIETKALVAALAEVLEPLEALRRHGQGHLNIRPENLLRGRDGVLTLVGLASAHLLDNVGGPYSAPELQVAKAAGGGALGVADLYSFALTFCALVGAEVLGAGTSTPWVQFPASVRESLRGVEGLRLVLEAALHQQPARRPASFSIVRRALLETLRVSAGSAQPSADGQWVSGGESENPGIGKPKTSGRALVFRAAAGAEDFTPAALVVPPIVERAGNEVLARLESEPETAADREPSTSDAASAAAVAGAAYSGSERRTSPRVALEVPEESPAERSPRTDQAPVLAAGRAAAAPVRAAVPPMRLPILRLHPLRASRRSFYRSASLLALALSALAIAGLLIAPRLRRAVARGGSLTLSNEGTTSAVDRGSLPPNIDMASRAEPRVESPPGSTPTILRAPSSTDPTDPVATRQRDQALRAVISAMADGWPHLGLAALAGLGAELDPELLAIREQLVQSLAELDREPPSLRLGPSQPDPYRLRVMVDDDYEVAALEVWARQGPGEEYRELAVDGLGGGVYEARLLGRSPQVWARAIDHSGHQAMLGSATAPLLP